MIKLYDILKEVNKKIPDEYIRNLAKQYDNKLMSDFFDDYPNLLRVIMRRGEEYYNDITKNMIKQKKKWTDEELEREAKKYNHKKDFIEGSPKAYNVAFNRGKTKDPKTGKIKYDPSFLKKITAHMTPLGDLKKRLIYVHEFTDENNKPVAAYVGLTYNSQLRYNQHTTGVNKLGKLKDTQVTKFIRENPTLKHTYKELTGFLEIDDAIKQEEFWEDKYKDDGWLILGKKRAGSIGGGSSNYIVKDSDLKDFVDAQAKNGLNLTDLTKKYPNQLNLIYTRKLHLPPYNYLEKFERKYSPYYTDENAFEKAMAYNSNGELRNSDPKLYSVLKSRKLLAKTKQAFEERNKTSIKVDEAKVVPATNLFQKYQYKIGDIVQEMYGNEELAKVIDIRPNYSAVEKNPIDMGFIPMWLERDTGELDNNPWYLLEWLGSNRNANRKTWWPESEIQIPDHDNWPIGDDDDYDDDE
jgi:hypothetical protein